VLVPLKSSREYGGGGHGIACGQVGSRVKVETNATYATADQAGGPAAAAAKNGGAASSGVGTRLHTAIASVTASPSRIATTIRGFWQTSAGPAANSVLGEHKPFFVTVVDRSIIALPPSTSYRLTSHPCTVYRDGISFDYRFRSRCLLDMIIVFHRISYGPTGTLSCCAIVVAKTVFVMYKKNDPLWVR
jgi:hypothetical protein